MLTTLNGHSPVDAFVGGDVDVAPIGFIDAGWIAYDRGLGPSLRSDPSLSVDLLRLRHPPAAVRRPAGPPGLRQGRRLAAARRRSTSPGRRSPPTGMVPAGIPGAPDGRLPARRTTRPAPASCSQQAGYATGADARPDLVHRQRRRLRRRHHRDARGEPGRRPSTTRRWTSHLPGRGWPPTRRACGASRGSRTTRAQRLPRRPARAPAPPPNQGGWSIADVRRRDRRRDVRGGPRGRDGGLRAARMEIVRDQAPAVPVTTARRTRSSATGCSARARTASGSSGSPGSRGRTADDAAGARRAAVLATWLAAGGLALLAVERRGRATGSSFGKPDAVADLRRRRSRSPSTSRDRAARSRSSSGSSSRTRSARSSSTCRSPAGTRRRPVQLRARRHRRRTPRPQHADQATWAAYPAPAAEPVVSGSDADPVRRTRPGLADARGRPDHGPLVRRRRGVRAQGARHRRAGRPRHGRAARRRPSPSPIDFFIYGDQDVVPGGPRAGHPRERRRPGARRHPDAVRADHARRDRRRRGSAIVVPARAHPPRVRHGRPQPVPVPAPLAQRGPRGLPVRGLRLAGPRPRRVRGVESTTSSR